MGFLSFRAKKVRAKAAKEQEKIEFSVKEPKRFSTIPHFSKDSEVDVKFELLVDFAYAHIHWDNERKKIIYDIEEPKLDEREKRALESIEMYLTENIDVKLSSLKGGQVIDYLVNKLEQSWSEVKVSVNKKSLSKILYYIYRDFAGLNEIEPIMHDPYIEDLGCTGIGSSVFVVHRVFGSIETNIIFDDEENFRNFIIKISEKCGRYISYASPLFDGTLPDGSRVQASLAKDVTTKGPTFSIRKVRKNPYTPTDLVGLKTVSGDMMAYLWFLVEHGASLLICGGAGSGKTTFLNALSMFIKRDFKIISIEDTREINIHHKNWIPTVTRTGFGLLEEGGKRYGEINMFDLLKESFRMKPDYVLVGEIRGEEAYVMFQGIASGHASMGTMHAASLSDVIKRLSTPPIDLSPYLIETLDAVIVISNTKEKGETSRRVKNISEIIAVDPESKNARTITTFTWIPATDEFRDTIAQSQVLRRVAFDEGMAYDSVVKELEDRKKVLAWMVRHGIVQYDEFGETVNMYYTDKEALMELVRADKKPSFCGNGKPA